MDRYCCINPKKTERKVTKQKALNNCMIKNCPYLKITYLPRRRRRHGREKSTKN